MLLLVSPHIHLAVIAIPFRVPQGLSPWFAITFAKGQLWSSKFGEFHPDDRTLLHFQVSLVTCPLLVEPNIPRYPPPTSSPGRFSLALGAGLIRLHSLPRLLTELECYLVHGRWWGLPNYCPFRGFDRQETFPFYRYK